MLGAVSTWLKKAGRWVWLALLVALSVLAPLWWHERKKRKQVELELARERSNAAVLRDAAATEARTAQAEREAREALDRELTATREERDQTHASAQKLRTALADTTDPHRLAAIWSATFGD